MPTCPKCQEFISESHYERHILRCGTTQWHKSQSLYVGSATARVENQERGTTYGPPGEDQGKRNWTKLAAGFVIFLLIGSLVVFFLLYAISFL